MQVSFRPAEGTDVALLVELHARAFGGYSDCFDRYGTMGPRNSGGSWQRNPSNSWRSISSPSG